jgi:hypothetical protein
MWTRFIFVKTGTRAGLLWQGNEPSGSTFWVGKKSNFLTPLALEEGAWSASHSGPFTPHERVSGTSYGDTSAPEAAWTLQRIWKCIAPAGIRSSSSARILVAITIDILILQCISMFQDVMWPMEYQSANCLDLLVRYVSRYRSRRAARCSQHAAHSITGYRFVSV